VTEEQTARRVPSTGCAGVDEGSFTPKHVTFRSTLLRLVPSHLASTAAVLIHVPPHHSPERLGQRGNHLTHLAALLVAVASFSLAAGDASASSPPDRGDAYAELIDRSPLADAANLSPSQIFTYLELDDPLPCGALNERNTLRRRTNTWREATNMLATSNPDFLHDWLIGRRDPPQVARRAARKQLHCMFDAMFEHAANADNDFHVDVFATESESLPSGSPGWVRRYNRQPHWRRRIRARLLRSHVRQARSQARIWVDKFDFHSDAFGRVSNHAAEICDLDAGRGWHPGWPSHRHCWQQRLSPRQREREILQTSSAPGISRHHWGTEFDIFSLRPSAWTTDGLFQDEYEWLTDNALQFGFFQPYHGPSPDRPHTYIEERWHWSYYPIATALTDYIRHNRDTVHTELVDQWESLADRHRSRDVDTEQQDNNQTKDEQTKDEGTNERVSPYFQYVETRWFDYVTDIVEPESSSEIGDLDSPEL